MGKHDHKTINKTMNKRALRNTTLVLVFLASIWGIAIWEEDWEWDSQLSDRRALSLQDFEHDIDRLCIASVNDGTISTATVVNEHDHLNLALPEDYETMVTVECTLYSRSNQLTEQSFINETYTETRPIKQGDKAFAPPSSDCGDLIRFQPGYFDHRTSTWHHQCADRPKASSDALKKSDGKLSLATCPVVNRKKDVWVQVVGDSVARQFIRDGLPESIELSYPDDYRLWFGNRNLPRSDFRPDFMLVPLMNDDSENQINQIWLSYEFNFISPKFPLGHWGISYTWGDFVRMRGQGRRGDDPDYADDRVPDIILFSPGYHASEMTSSDYGSSLDEVLRKWQDTINSYNTPMPQMHLMLNMMPAPWMIPKKYASDKSFRTLLNEYRKNLVIIDTAKKYDGFVKSVVDVFSIELPFNGKDGATAHKDAVHIGDRQILRAGADIIVDTICYSEANDDLKAQISYKEKERKRRRRVKERKRRGKRRGE